MIVGNSRYSNASQITVTGHAYDKYRRLHINGDDPTSTDPMTRRHTILYRLPEKRSTTNGNIVYPVKQDETLQMLAYKVLKNHDAWWQVAEYNTNLWYPLDTYPGLVLNIPL